MTRRAILFQLLQLKNSRDKRSTEKEEQTPDDRGALVGDDRVRNLKARNAKARFRSDRFDVQLVD